MTTQFAAQFEPRSWMFVAAAAAATFVVLTGLQRFKRRRESLDAPMPSSDAVPSQPMPQAAERWQVDLHDFTREVEARLDTKLAVLQRLLAAADERIAHLESLGLDESPREKTSSVAGPHFSKLEAAPQGQARTAAIFAMADAGNNAASIANRLGTPIAEVELILSLRRTAS